MSTIILASLLYLGPGQEGDVPSTLITSDWGEVTWAGLLWWMSQF